MTATRTILAALLLASAAFCSAEAGEISPDAQITLSCSPTDSGFSAGTDNPRNSEAFHLTIDLERMEYVLYFDPAYQISVEDVENISRVRDSRIIFYRYLSGAFTHAQFIVIPYYEMAEFDFSSFTYSDERGDAECYEVVYNPLPQV